MKKDKKYYALYGYNQEEPILTSNKEMQYNPINADQNANRNLSNVGMAGLRNIGNIISGFMTGAPQLINALLPDQPLEEEDRTLPRAINPYPMGTDSEAIYKDGGELKKYPKGGKVEPIYTRDPNDPRLQAYNDSLNLHNISTETYRLKRIHENAVKLHQNKQGSYENTTKTLNNLFEYIYNTEDTYDKALERLNNPTPIILPKYAFDVPIYKKPVQPIIYRENPPLEQMTQLDTEPFPTYREEPPTLKKLGRMMNVPYSYERGSGLGWRRESGYRPEYVEYKDGGYIKKTRKAGKKGRIQVTEEIPEALPVDETIDYISPTSQKQISYVMTSPQLETRALPEQPKRVEFERLLDTEGNITGYSPIFSNNYSYWDALSTMRELPEQFGGIPVVKNPEFYGDLWEGFIPRSMSYDWTKSNPNFKNGGTIDYQVGQELDLTMEQIKELLSSGYELEF